MYPFDRFTESAKELLTLAQSEAERAGHSYIGTEHLLLGMIAEPEGLAGRALRSFGLDLAAMRATVEKVLSTGPGVGVVQQQMLPTSRVKRIIEMAFEEASVNGQTVVGTDNLLVAVIAEGQGIAAQVLLEQGVTVERASAEIGRLKDQGATDKVRPGAPASRKHRHLEVADSQGRPVHVDLIFPAEYSDAECASVSARIRQAIPEP
jgi:ATP-dependent Clp protease ATP-binding subunit ClpC